MMDMHVAQCAEAQLWSERPSSPEAGHACDSSHTEQVSILR